MRKSFQYISKCLEKANTFTYKLKTHTDLLWKADPKIFGEKRKKSTFSISHKHINICIYFGSLSTKMIIMYLKFKSESVGSYQALEKIYLKMFS